MTQVGEKTKASVIKIDDVEENLFAGVKICYPNGNPYTHRVDLTASINGSEIPGVFNFDGEFFSTMLEPGTQVKYEIEKDVDNDLTLIRKKIEITLAAIITQELADAKIYDDKLNTASYLEQAAMYHGAFMTGVGEGALGLIEFVGDGLELGGKTLWFSMQTQVNIMEAAWESYAEGNEKDFFTSIEEKEVEDFAEIFGVTPKKLVENMTGAFEMVNFIYEDSDTKGMLADFAVDYTKAQSSLELVQMAGSATFDIVLAAILAATTGGAGNIAQAVQVGAKLRHVTLLRTLGEQLTKLVRMRKQKMVRKSVTGQLGTTKKVTVKPPIKVPLEKGKVNIKSKEDKASKKTDEEKNKNTDKKATKNTDISGTTKDGKQTPPTKDVRTGGEPISLVTGEELLTLTDFELQGTVPISWVRTYRSSNPDNIGLGHGWTHPLAETLVINENNLELNDAEGRVIPFKIPAVGQDSINRAEQLQLKRLSTKAYILTSTVGHSRARYFDSDVGGDTLQLTQIRDPQGNQLRLHYKNNRLQRIQADFGDAWFFDYTKQGNLSSINWRTSQGHQKNMVQYAYDDNDDQISATDAQGNIEHYAYNNHIISQRTLKSGYSFYFAWDGDTTDARCIRNWGDEINGKPTYDYHFKWDPANHRVAMTDTRGGTTYYQFNERGLPIYEKDPEGGETRYTYDARGNLITQIDPLGNSEHFAYNDDNTLRAYTNKQGESQHIARDAHGNITQVTDPLGQKWRSAYNKQGQLISQTNPLGDTHHYQYNEIGLVNNTEGPTGIGMRYIWDNQARLVAIGNPEGKHTRYRYNQDSQITHITWPDKKVTEYRYNANGQCIAIKDPDGKVSQFAYNPLGLLTHQEDSNNRRTEYQYNGLSQVVRRIDPAKQSLDYHYDGERNLIGLTNEKGEHYHLNYDLNERLTQEIGFDGRVQRYRYNAAGQLIASEDVSNDGKSLISQIDYQRNKQGQLLQQIDAKNQQLINAFNYDKLGRLTDAKNTHRHLQWQYDELGRVIEDKQGHQTLKHQYNSLGQRIASELPNGDKVNYHFASSGQFEGVSYNDQTVTHITRDDMGRETQRQLSNQLVTDHSYDPQGRLQRQTTYKQSASSDNATSQATKLSDRQYHYNPQGQLSQIDDQRRGSTHYHYDALDRLTQVQGPNPESFVHDPAGNILSIETPEKAQTQQQKSAPQSAQKGQIQGNRIAFQGDTHYQYDSKGNRIAQARGKNKKLKTYYKYNALNQLEAIENNGKLTEYAYDPLGRRISKQSATGTTNFLWMEDVLLSETTEQKDSSKQEAQANNKKEEKTYLFEPGTFKPLAFVQNKNIYHYHLDHLGTPQEISDAEGNIVWAVSFKAYGNLAVAYENEIENNIRFQGQYFDEETGLHYNRFRYYDPICGRFINQDPIGLMGGNNNYLYVPNPTGWVDPFGLTAKEGDCGIATIYKIGRGKNVHFAIKVETKAGTAKSTHQTGMEGTKTLMDEFDPKMMDAEIEEIKINVPNPKAAIAYQSELLKIADKQYLDANFDMKKLNTPDYDITNQSCLTHVFSVLSCAGVENMPTTSPPTRDTARVISGLKKQSIK